MHHKPLKDLYKELKTSEKGLTEGEARKRIVEYGLNEIKEKRRVSPLKIFLSQFHNFLGIAEWAHILIAVMGVLIIGIIKTKIVRKNAEEAY